LEAQADVNLDDFNGFDESQECAASWISFQSTNWHPASANLFQAISFLLRCRVGRPSTGTYIIFPLVIFF
jgi:hypothetical protein